MYARSTTPVRDGLNAINPDHVTDAVDPLIAKLLIASGGHIPAGSLGLHGGQALTAADVADALDAFIGYLRLWSEKAQVAEDELRALKADVAAFRRILGTTPEQS